jgi:hypothetical protein
LQTLDLSFAQVSVFGLEELQAARPRLRILR